MSDIIVLRARLRKRDKDIQQAVSNLKLEEGEMADMIRDGFRRMLAEKGLIPSLSRSDAQTIARELVKAAKEKGPEGPSA